MNELISVIIPVYNVEKFLNRCINSVVNQTYQNLEILLINDGSSDNSGEICDCWAKKDDRIKVVHKSNGGLSSARNCGLNIAKGKYIAFLDSDDWIDLKTYEIMINNMIIHDVDIVDVDAISTTGKVNNVANYNCSKSAILEGIDILKDYIITNKVSVWRKLYRKETIGNIRFPEGKIYEDIATNFRILQNAKRLIKLPIALYYYFQNPNSISNGRFSKKDLDLIFACDSLVNLASFNKDLTNIAFTKRIMAYYSLIGKYIRYHAVDIDDPDGLAKNFQKELRKNFFNLMCSHIRTKKKIGVIIICSFNLKFLRILYHLIRGRR